MYKELILFRNELKNKSIPKYKIIGIVSELLLSKQIFAKNADIEEFKKFLLQRCQGVKKGIEVFNVK